MLEQILNIVSGLFVVSELTLLAIKKSKKSEVRDSRDRSSKLIIWIFIAVGIFCGIFVARRMQLDHREMGLVVGGICIFVIGMIIRLSAIYQLGKEFTVDVVIGKEHKLHDTGLYKRVRHPSYSGMVLEFIGLSMLFNSYYAIPAVVLPVLLALIYRMNIEEKALKDALGPPYADYMKRTKRILPGIY
jgi:protein-S-isoprenylcysteine O-methyltransferase Ste14